MASTLRNCRIGVSLSGERVQTLDQGESLDRLVLAVSLAIANGTNTSQANGIWMDTRTVSASANDDIDLTSLTQQDSAGDDARPAINFAVVKAIVAYNTNTAGGSGNITIGAATTAFDGAGTPFVNTGDQADLVPGGVFVWYNPVGVSTSSANELRFAGVTADQTYKIAIIGETA